MSGEKEEPPRPGNFDRAWNDPPLFNYSKDGAAQPAATKLTKRVGFPVAPPPSGTAATSSAGQPLPPSLEPLKIHDAGAKPVGSSMPPPPPMMSAGPSPTKTKEPADVTAAADPSIDVETVVHKLNTALQSTSLDDKKKADLKKRFTVMETKWKTGALNDQVQTRMGKLAQCLDNNDPLGAEKIQVSLSVDWPSLCGTWIIGIKHLVVHLKEAMPEEGRKTEVEGIAQPLPAQ